MWKNKKNSNCHWISFGKIFLYFPEAEKQRTTVWQPHRQQLSMSPRERKPATRSVVRRQPPAPTYWDPPWCSRGGHAFPRLFTANNSLVQGLQPGRFHQCRTLLNCHLCSGAPSRHQDFLRVVLHPEALPTETQFPFLPPLLSQVQICIAGWSFSFLCSSPFYLLQIYPTWILDISNFISESAFLSDTL